MHCTCFARKSYSQKYRSHHPGYMLFKKTLLTKISFSPPRIYAFQESLTHKNIVLTTQDICFSRKPYSQKYRSHHPGYILFKKALLTKISFSPPRIYAFQESLTHKNIVLTTQDICCELNSEITIKIEFYKTFANSSVNVALELDNFLREPLSLCSWILLELYCGDLSCRCNKVLWVTNFQKGLSDKKLYFARSLSEHIDSIVPQKKRSLPSTSSLYKSVAAETRKKEWYDLLFDTSSLDEEYDIKPVPREHVPWFYKRWNIWFTWSDYYVGWW